MTGFIKHYLIRRTLQLGDKSNPHRTLSTGSSSFENEVTSIQERTRAEHTHVPRNHHYLDFFELQDIPWKTELGIDRSHARNARDRLYHSYQNLKFEPHGVSVDTFPYTDSCNGPDSPPVFEKLAREAE